MNTSAELENLLMWLGHDAQTGALRYEEMRQRLVILFRFRGCDIPEELADETLDRTARAILKPGFTLQGNPMAYMRGVARNVHLEWRRTNRKVSLDESSDLIDRAASKPIDDSEIEPIYASLDRCLAKLPIEKRRLLLRYYDGEQSAKIDGRLQLAYERGIDLNNLRLQVFRLRRVVRKCVERSAKAGEIELQF